MTLSSKPLFGIPITISPEFEILEYISEYLNLAESGKRKAGRNTQPLTIFTPNPEIIVAAKGSAELEAVLRQGDINLPDGAGISWALKKHHHIKVDRLSGVDMMKKLCEKSVVWGVKVGLLGGNAGVAEEAGECLQREIENLDAEVFDVGGVRIMYQVSSIKYKENHKDIHNTKYLILNTNGDQEERTDRYFRDLVKRIGETDTQILFVALGCPKQEFFIQTLREYLLKSYYDKPIVLMAVGGAFDYLSGRQRRAPKFVQQFGLEWLYRLGSQPSRLGRQLTGARFFLLKHTQDTV